MTQLTIELIGETEILITRHFAGTPQQVYRAHTEADLIRQWLLGPDGWTMPQCQSDARPGGSFRYDYVKGERSFAITGDYIDTVPFSHLEHVERMFLPDPTPDCRVITHFAPAGGGTRMDMRILLPDAATRDAMVATGMTKGMEASYDRLEAHLPELIA